MCSVCLLSLLLIERRHFTTPALCPMRPWHCLVPTAPDHSATKACFLYVTEGLPPQKVLSDLSSRIDHPFL